MKMYNFKSDSKESAIWWACWPTGLYLCITFGVVFVSMFFLALFLAYEHGSVDPTELQNVTMKYTVHLNILIQFLCIMVYVPVYMIFKRKAYPKVDKPCNWKVYTYAIIAFLGISSLSSFLISFLSPLIEPIDGGMDKVNDWFFSAPIAVTFITTVILAPIAEELMIRGLTLNKLLSVTDEVKAMMISALIFGLAHLNIMQGMNAFVVGMTLAYIYIKTRSIILCIGCHSINNLIAVISIYLSNLGSKYANMYDLVVTIVCIGLGVIGTYLFVISDRAKLKSAK